VAPPEIFGILNPWLQLDTSSRGSIDFIASWVLGAGQIAPGELIACAKDLTKLGGMSIASGSTATSCARSVPDAGPAESVSLQDSR
jgi:hypothetical protein